jgi:AcrR family transcriptional regulator
MPRRSDGTREKLYAAAVELIAQNGYEGTTIDDIVAKAGVAKGTVYYHFKGKAELVQALIEDGLEKRAVEFEKQAHLELPPPEALAGLVSLVIDDIRNNQAFGRLLMSEIWRSQGVWREGLVMMRERFAAAFCEVVTKGQESGDFLNRVDPTLAGGALYGMVITSTLEWLVFQPELDASEVCAVTTRLALGAVHCRTEI